MTNIGTIRLKYEKQMGGVDGVVFYRSENSGYRLQVPRKPEFVLLPDYIEIRIATEDQWISPGSEQLESYSIQDSTPR